MIFRLFFIFLLCSIVSGWGRAQPPVLGFELIATGLDKPLDITGAGDGSGRLFVLDQDGLIWIVDLNDNNNVLSTPFLDITDRVRCCGERGLLGLAFDPDYKNNGFFFVNYVSNGLGAPNTGETVIARFQAAAPADLTVDKNTETIILTVDQPFGNHNAGDLVFGPDSLLYVPLGDGGSGGDPGNRSQNPQLRLGKLLRIDIRNTTTDFDFDIPADNPFVDDAGVLDEIFATGLRNPFRIAFDPAGNLWIADVGQGEREEVNMLPAGTSGQNFGWKCREGFIAFSPGDCPEDSTLTEPIFDYGRDFSDGGVSITGGGVYRGRFEDLQGYYICADFGSSNFFLLPPDGGRLDTIIQRQNTVNSISTFGEDDDGNMYVADLNADVIYEIVGRTIPVSTPAFGNPAQKPKLVPNPTDRDFSLIIPELQVAGPINVRVFSGDGRLVYQKMHLEDGGPVRTNYVLPDVPAGVYQVLITYDNLSYLQRLVVR